MVHRNAVPSALANEPTHVPYVTSYDLGYEHSLEHWTEIQQLVRAADQESGIVHQASDHGILIPA
jgi:hypothetical protein